MPVTVQPVIVTPSMPLLLASYKAFLDLASPTGRPGVLCWRGLDLPDALGDLRHQGRVGRAPAGALAPGGGAV